MSKLAPEPVQPPESTWSFVHELQRPLWRRLHRQPREPRRGEAVLKDGVSVQARFPDPSGVLETAYADLGRFLAAAGVSRNGPYQIVTGRISTDVRETYRVVVGRDRCEILAGDTEGIRRGLFFLEDEMLRAGGPVLKIGAVERRPVVRTRISRCFFGPIHRPPRNRDELTDDTNYYPDEYLNRLAHEAVNGLWLTIHFAEICPQTVIPEYGRDPGPRLEKLRQTVARCARYGIKIYAYCNEPIPIAPDSEVARAHPELVGAERWGGLRYFCTSNPTALAYLEEAMRGLFSEAPGLGGIINISIGEHGSHCYSGSPSHISCPRCRDRTPIAVLNDTMAAMARGMHAADPNAECISWPYGQYWAWGDEMTVDSAGRLPEGIILQHNFESSAVAEQCGRKHRIFDYWLSYIGPSKLFADCAKAAVPNGNRVFAKLQVGCSHEVATAPFVPVPGHLYRKYRAMHELGVSGVMQCWYFGNHPGLMTKAAGELAFAPFPETEDRFLMSMARRDWGEDARAVVRAWKLFQRGYSHFPLNHIFGWYGPMHDAVVWPLHLEPADRIISPSWQIASSISQRPYPASGDRIGECFYYSHTLEEILALCREMAQNWNRGVAILHRLLPHYTHDEERRRDIGVATALGIQFESGYNVLRFYALREELPWQSRAEQKALLAAMRRIVKRELARDAELLALCEADSRLGFHSEAEGYKYFPAKIEWRRQQLQGLLDREFPQVARQVRDAEPLWPAFTGQRPEGPCHACPRAATPPRLDGRYDGPVWDGLPEAELEVRNGKRSSADQTAPAVRTFWKACHDGSALYFAVRCVLAADAASASVPDETVTLRIEPRRLWPCQSFSVSARGSRSASDGYDLQHFLCCQQLGNTRSGAQGPRAGHLRRSDTPPNSGASMGDSEWTAAVSTGIREWSATIRVPLRRLRPDGSTERPMRVDVERRAALPGSRAMYSWMEQHPLEERLAHGSANPADLGWLILG